jgi:hypothetical protein
MRKNSIDYLFQQLWDTPKDKLTWYAILKEVKKMHKQEIIDAYQTSHISMMTAEQHYREAFED